VKTLNSQGMFVLLCETSGKAGETLEGYVALLSAPSAALLPICELDPHNAFEGGTSPWLLRT
jgi:uncharacterized protein YdbL (DUF1318 family)